MAAANLAIDEAASGNRPQADRLLADALRRYEETLTAEHPEARARRAGDPPHRGDRAVVSQFRSRLTRSRTWVMSRSRSAQ